MELEQILVRGDLQELSVKQRLDYELAVCKSMKLNPLTKPFEWIWFKNFEDSKLVLQMYATKNCTDQLRKTHKISTVKVENTQTGDYCISTVWVRDKNGREDMSTGAVFCGDARVGQKFGDCIMWAETKAKRRATLSICGLGFLDETEIHSLTEYGMLTAGGRMIVEKSPLAQGHVETPEEVAAKKLRAAGVEPGTFYFVWDDESDLAMIDGDPALLATLNVTLRPYWNAGRGRFVVKSEEDMLSLRKILDERGVKYRYRGTNHEQVERVAQEARS